MQQSLTSVRRRWPGFRLGSVVRSLMPLCVLLTALPLTPVHGGGATAILLRYKFVAGQHFAYRLAGGVHEDTAQVAHPPMHESLSVDGIVSYRILNVSATGVADAAARLESAVTTNTVNGKSQVFRISPALTTRETPQLVRLGPDNSLPGRTSKTITSNSYGNYGLQAIGALPSYAVTPGQHWQSSAVDNLASGINSAIPDLPHVRLIADNSLVGLSIDAGIPVALISSHSIVNYDTDTTRSGQIVHVHATGSLNITSLFDLSRRNLRASTAAFDITYTVTTPIAEGARILARTHFTDDATLRPYKLTP